MANARETIPGRRGPAALTAGLWLVVCVLQLGFLDLHSLWNNEFITVQSIELPYGAMIRERVEHNHMPAYFIVLKAWTALAGMGQRALHLPSALATLAGIFCIWMLARELFGAGWAALALALAGFNQIAIDMSNDARMYSWLFLSAAATLWALLHYLERGGRGALAAIAAAGLFGLAAHLLYLLVTASIAVFLAATWRRGPRRGPALAAALAPVILVAPLIVWWGDVQNKVGGRPGWRAPKFSNGQHRVVEIMLGDMNNIAHHAAWFKTGEAVLIAMIVLTLLPHLGRLWAGAARWTRARLGAAGGLSVEQPADGRLTALLWIWTVLPMLAIVLAEVRSASKMSGAWRYFITIEPAATLLLTSALRNAALLGGRRLAAALAVVPLAVIVNNTLDSLRSPGPGIREAVQILKVQMRPRDLVVASQDKNRTKAFEYYGLMDHFPPEKPNAVKTPQQVLAWLKPLCAGHERLWVVYYKDTGEDDVYPVIRAHPELFTPQGKLWQWDDNMLGLYRISPALSGAAGGGDSANAE